MGVAEIRRELLEDFPALEQKAIYLDQCAEIGALLEEGEKSLRVTKALGQLDQRMYALIRSRIQAAAFKNAEDAPQFKGQPTDTIHRTVVDSMASNFGAFKPKSNPSRQKLVGDLAPFTGKQDPFSKVLATVLAEDERGCAYPENKDEQFHPRYYVGFVKREPFLDTIRTGRHWKDVGASPLHGEYAHRLQWYVIANAGVVEKNKVGELYRFIGQFRDESKRADRLGQKDLWPRLCDRPRADFTSGGVGGASSAGDFRAPEHFTSHLLNAAAYPILSAFVKARYEKRLAGMGSETDFPSETSMRQYTARKLFGKPFNALETNEKEIVVGLASGVADSGKPNSFDKKPK